MPDPTQPVYVFDYDNTLAAANAPLTRPLAEMPRLLARCLLSGARVCIATVKSIDERNGLLREAYARIRHALAELADEAVSIDCSPDEARRNPGLRSPGFRRASSGLHGGNSSLDYALERLELYPDKTASRYVTQNGALVADQTYHQGITPPQLAQIKQLLHDTLHIPPARVIDYPGSLAAQFALTDSWGRSGHAIVYYHAEFGEAVKVLVKPYGWEEAEYVFEKAASPAKPTRHALAARLTRDLHAAGLRGFVAEPGGSVALDMTATDKSRVIAALYARGYRHVQYYGDDRYGSDKAVFELAASGLARFPGLHLDAILVQGPAETYSKLLLALFHRLHHTFTAALAGEFADQAAKVLMAHYTQSGDLLREAITLLVAIAMLPEPERSQAGLRALFASVVEALNDRYQSSHRLAYYRIFAQVITCCRHYPRAQALDAALRRFGLTDEAALVARALRIRAPQSVALSDNISKVLILSRVTLGADMAITSLAIAKMSRLLPHAEIVLVGSPLLRALFGGHPRVRVAEVRYARGGGLAGRLETWLQVLAVIEAETGRVPPFATGSYLIIDPDSRLTQVGLLPLTPDDTGYFFFEPEMDSDKLLAVSFNEWLNQVFPEADNPILYPRLYLLAADVALARDLFAKCNLEKQHVIGVHFGTGGVESKTVSLDFEVALLARLIAEGATVMLYQGVNGEEAQRTARLIARLRTETAFEIVTIRQTDIAILHSVTAQLIVFADTDIGVSAAILGQCHQVVAYSSSSKHIAAAQQVPVTVIYVREAGFIDRWQPYTRAGADVVRITPEQKTDKNGILNQVMASIRRLKAIVRKNNC